MYVNVFASLVAEEVDPGLYNDIVTGLPQPLVYKFRYATDVRQLLFFTMDLTVGDHGWIVVG
mgnify:CR=1 FL=1